MRTSQFILLYWIGALTCCSCTTVVSVTSLSQEANNMLHGKLEEATQDQFAEGSRGSRVVLGAIEATMSRVVDSDSAYVEEKVISVPVMARLSEMTFDVHSQKWTIRYETMKHNPNSLTNTFHRLVYLTKKNVAVAAGDTTNPVLTGGDIDDLKNKYVTDLNADFLHDHFINDQNVEMQVTDLGAHSLRQNLTITIKHDFLIQNLAKKSVSWAREYSNNLTTWTFGIGMIFTNMESNNKMLMFDNFHLYEQNVAFFNVIAETRYSLAQHVEFYALSVPDSSIRIAVFHFTLDTSKILDNYIMTAINGESLLQSKCQETQLLIDALDNPHCLITYEVCKPKITVLEKVTAVSYAIPILPGVTSTNLLLNLTDADSGLSLLSSLNFKLSTSTDVCQSDVVALHDPLQWVEVKLYPSVRTGLGNPRTISGGNAYGNVVVDHTGSEITMPPAEIMSQSLLTLSIGPKQSAEAQAYFASTTQHLNLDDLIMSHAIVDPDTGFAVLPPAPTKIQADSQTYRAGIDFREQLACPMETFVKPNPTNQKCVTTRDWNSDGIVNRYSSENPFVYQAGLANNTVADKNWLKWVFGVVDGNENIEIRDHIDLHIQQTMLLLLQHTKVFWVWPVYHWETSPINLKDQTLISFAWSVTSSQVGRRLLSLPPIAAKWKPVTSAKPYLMDLKHVDSRCIFCGNSTIAKIKHVFREKRSDVRFKRRVPRVVALHDPLHVFREKRSDVRLNKRVPLETRLIKKY